MDLIDNDRVEVLETTNLPLKPINYSIFLSMDDLKKGKPWPPERFKERNDNISLLRSLWDGDLSVLLSARDHRAVRVYSNHFRTEISQITNLLLTSDIEISTSGADQADTPSEIVISEHLLEDALGKALIDQQRYGGAILSLIHI